MKTSDIMCTVLLHTLICLLAAFIMGFRAAVGMSTIDIVAYAIVIGILPCETVGMLSLIQEEFNSVKRNGLLK